MNAADRFGARVSKRPPRIGDVVAPERDVDTGRYRRELRHDDKGRRTRTERARPPRSTPRAPRRRVHARHVAAVGAAVLLAGGGAVILAGGGEDGAAPSAVETTAAAVPGTADAPPANTAPATSTSAATATTPEATATTVAARASLPTGTIVPLAAANALAGRYALQMTITDGNSNFPVGTARAAEITLVPDCTGDSCRMRSPEYADSFFTVDGASLTLQMTVPEPCEADPSVNVESTLEVVLEVSGQDADGLPTALTGTQTQSTPDAAACPNTENDPITWSISGTRVG